MRNSLLFAVLLSCALTAAADELARAEQLAWDKQFAASESLYRQILAKEPPSRRARLGLARVVMWSGRYREAIALFNTLPNDLDALEGRATAEYWSGDFRGAARDFKRVLQLDPKREFPRTSLAEIASVTRPSQRIAFGGVRDDQPLDVTRGEVSATFFSDPLSRWTATLGETYFDAARRGTRKAELVRLDNETRWRDFVFAASAGAFDGHFIGDLSARWRQLTVRMERQEEVASATSIRNHELSTTTSVRWSHDRNWVAAVEASHRAYTDDNHGYAFVAYGVAPVLKRGGWTVWAGGSGAARDTEQSRFHATAISSTLEGGAFRYTYRGEYDPYWTPDDLREVRAVLALERSFEKGRIKLHADAGTARDKGRAFGPDLGIGPFPPSVFTFAFDRSYNPYRFGMTADFAIPGPFRIEAGAERSVTVDYRSTSFHAALVRRR